MNPDHLKNTSILCGGAVRALHAYKSQSHHLPTLAFAPVNIPKILNVHFAVTTEVITLRLFDDRKWVGVELVEIPEKRKI
jgi:hypothetical protein